MAPASSSDRSRLVELFAQRAAGNSAASAEQTMLGLIERTRRKKTGSLKRQLHWFMHDRRVDVCIKDALPYEAQIEPLGAAFGDGFKVTLRNSTMQARRRFVLAHEICHTYFYEYVPELKYVPHDADPYEERLCNLGAGALLIPEDAVASCVRGQSVSLASLENAAREFEVSPSAMICRLRQLNLWNCSLSYWRRMTNGTFVLASIFGARRREWVWEEDATLDNAWCSHETLIGGAFVYYSDQDGLRLYAPVTFEVRRSGDVIVALWGRGVGIQKKRSKAPLLHRHCLWSEHQR